MQKTEKSHWEPRYASREKRMQASEIRDLLKLLDKAWRRIFCWRHPRS